MHLPSHSRVSQIGYINEEMKLIMRVLCVNSPKWFKILLPTSNRHTQHSINVSKLLMTSHIFKRDRGGDR